MSSRVPSRSKMIAAGLNNAVMINLAPVRIPLLEIPSTRGVLFAYVVGRSLRLVRISS